MIKFKTVRWKNFLSTGNAFTEIKLDGFENSLIVGENGAGKSTLLDAICYALFGEPFRKINIPTLVNSVNGSDMVVEIDFIINNHQYQVRRGIKPALFEIWKDGNMIDQTGAREQQAFLETQILHMNKKVFTQVDILGNANYVPFMQLKASDRRMVIEDILDIQIFSVMNELLKTRQRTVKEKLVINKHNTDIAETESKLKNEHIEELKRNKQAEIDENNDKIQENLDIITQIEKKIETLEKKLEEHTLPIQNKPFIIEKQQKASLNKSKISDKKLKAQTEVNFWSNTQFCPTCEQAISKEKAEEKLNEINASVIEYDSAIIKLSDLLCQYNESMVLISTHEAMISSINADIVKSHAEIRMRNNLIRDYKMRKLLLEKQAGNLESESAELRVIEDKLKSLEQEKKDLNEESIYLEVTATLLKDSGIKTRIIKQYLPIINKLVNKYLADMDFFVNFELDESFKETIKSRYRDDFSYENFSEGEKQRIDMALMLTWREVAKMKNSAASNLLVLDEIFDSSLDGAGVDYLMQLLHSLDKCNLFVISHKGDILQDKFQNVIRFHKTGNYSRIA